MTLIGAFWLNKMKVGEITFYSYSTNKWVINKLANNCIIIWIHSETIPIRWDCEIKLWSSIVFLMIHICCRFLVYFCHYDMGRGCVVFLHFVSIYYHFELCVMLLPFWIVLYCFLLLLVCALYIISVCVQLKWHFAIIS